MKSEHLERVESLLSDIENETIRVLRLSVDHQRRVIRFLNRFVAVLILVIVGLGVALWMKK